MPKNTVHEELKKLMQEGKDFFQAMEIIEKSGLFKEEEIDDWFNRFNSFRNKN